MTDHNIKDKNIVWKTNLENELQDSSNVTREALLKKWIKPENLKKQEDLKKIEKRKEKELLLKNSKKIN
jgi:hypothetical protein